MRLNEPSVPGPEVCYDMFRVDLKKLEYGSGTNYAGVPSSLGFGVGDNHIETSGLYCSTSGISV